VLSFYGVVCMSPLWLEEIWGKRSTPSVGWEAPVRSRQSLSESCTEHGTSLEAGDKATVRSSFLVGRWY
jgi:hypothetical protein